MEMLKSAWSNSNLAAAHMLAAVEDLKALGCYELEFAKTAPGVHRPDSRHYVKGALGFYCAADMNLNPNGEKERDWFMQVGQFVAREHGLAITCGIYGYVQNHSGSNMHMHIDDGEWSAMGDTKTPVVKPWTAKPTQLAWPVRAFQKKHGLKVDGIAGKLTYGALWAAVGTSESAAERDRWRAVQAHVGASQDGIPGPQTWGRMGLAIRKGAL